MVSLFVMLAHASALAGPRRVVLQIDGETTDIPSQSCREARASGLDWAQVRLASDTPPPLVEPQLPDVVFNVDADEGKPSELPPGQNSFDPNELPPQLLEGDAVDLWRVGEVMRRAAAGERVRMTFFGASHTGGDYWTGHIRRVLQTRYGDGGHGFVLPAALYAGYRGNDVNLCSSDGWFPDYAGAPNSRRDGLLGLGMTVTAESASDFGWIETTQTNPHGQQVDRYQIFALGQPEGGGLAVAVDTLTPHILQTSQPEQGLVHAMVEVPRGGHRLTLSPVGDGPVQLFGVSMEQQGPGVVVDAIGVRGRQARHMLQWNPQLATEMLSMLSPDLVVLAYGTNEAADSDYDMTAYAGDLRQALQQMRQGAPHAACVLVGPSDRGVYTRGRRNPPSIYERTEPVAQVQREVAPEFGCVFWDWQQATGGPGSMIAWRESEPALAARDLIHFSAAGYAHSAARFVDALDLAARTPLQLLELSDEPSTEAEPPAE